MEAIRNLEQLLQFSPRFAGTTVVKHRITRLTRPDQNNRCLMLSIELKYLDEHNGQGTADLIGKKIPESEWVRNMFNVQSSFKKELEFYKTIVPTLRTFLAEQNRDKLFGFFPEYHGGRINLNGSCEVDKDAVILLENLIPNGFQLSDPTIGFDKETTEFILRNLAVFHALPVALKLKKPKIFQEKVLPHLGVLPPLKHVCRGYEADLYNEKANIARKNASISHLTKRVYAGMKRGKKNCTFLRAKPREPFATMRHNDFWVNNTIMRFYDGKAIENKMIDFQIIDYGSPAGDLVFFLFSSVQLSVIRDNYEYFVTYYHHHFLETLKGLNCDIETFDLKTFQVEIDIEAKTLEFFHLMVMLNPIFAPKDNIKSLEELSLEDMKYKNIFDAYNMKAWFIIEEFAKRKWI